MIRLIANILVPTNKSQFRLREDPNSDNRNHFAMNGEKVTLYDDNLVCKTNGKTFTLRGDVLKMITGYKFNTTNSPDAKLNIDIMDEIQIIIHSCVKNLRDKNLIKNYFKK